MSTAFTGAAVLGPVISLVGWFAAPALSRLCFQSTSQVGLLRLSLATYAFAPLLETALVHLRALNRASHYVAVCLTKLVLQVSLNVFCLAYLRFGVRGPLLAEFCTTALISLSLTAYSMRAFNLRFCVRRVREFLRYSAPYGIGGICMIAVHSGDRFFLQRFGSFAELGIYALAYKLGMVIEYLVQPFATYWNAQVFSVLKTSTGEAVYIRLCTYLVLCLTGAAVCVTAFAHPVLRVMLPKPFLAAASIVPYIAFAYVLRAADQYFRNVLRVEGRTGRDARVMAVGAITSLITYAIFIPWLKGVGAALATLCAFTVMVAFGLWEAQHVRFVQFEFRRLAQIVTCAAVAVACSAYLGPVGTWEEWCLAGGITILFPVLLLVTGFFRDSELGALGRAVRQCVSYITRPGWRWGGTA